MLRFLPSLWLLLQVPVLLGMEGDKDTQGMEGDKDGQEDKYECVYADEYNEGCFGDVQECYEEPVKDKRNIVDKQKKGQMQGICNAMLWSEDSKDKLENTIRKKLSPGQMFLRPEKGSTAVVWFVNTYYKKLAGDAVEFGILYVYKNGFEPVGGGDTTQYAYRNCVHKVACTTTSKHSGNPLKTPEETAAAVKAFRAVCFDDPNEIYIEDDEDETVNKAVDVMKSNPVLGKNKSGKQWNTYGLNVQLHRQGHKIENLHREFPVDVQQEPEIVEVSYKTDKTDRKWQKISDRIASKQRREHEVEMATKNGLKRTVCKYLPD